jgi:hypothetical protein
MNASRGRSRNRVKNKAVSARCGRGSRGLGFVLVALWGNGATPSVLKCHETGAILCGYGLVGNLQTRETSEFQALGLYDQRQARHGKPIAIIQGHPDASGQHVCDTLADEYAKGTEDGGHEVKRIDVARLDFPILRTKGEFEKGALPLSPGTAQEAISWADYLVLFRPQSQEPRAQHPGLLRYRPDQGKPHRHHRGDDRKTAGRLAG